ncbi:2384_t:CDS:10 [Paraglomus occultum]|uniref:2384_t:CDS:1 n=1 Tax=Paraglomus occultum TaxID=144539 RepID=A0A9N8VQN3_9GLOM|nr:2384_t:CDS:10 [Paraglomus occultum]
MFHEPFYLLFKPTFDLAIGDIVMEGKFEKIRIQINSKLDNQKQIAQLLLAVEQTIKEQNVAATATAYFGALMTILDQTSQNEKAKELRGPILYILNMVLPELPQAILRNKFNEIWSILSQVLEEKEIEAAMLRSVAGCLESLLLVQDAQKWNDSLARKAFTSLLLLSVDRRPKPRKRAQDAVISILNHPPVSSVLHPAAGMASEYCLRILKTNVKSDRQSAMHILSLVKAIAGNWPANGLTILCQTLLSLPKYNDAFLTVSTFEVFEALFRNNGDGFANNGIEDIIKSLVKLTPNIQDVQVAPVWLEVVSRGYVMYSKVDPSSSAQSFHDFFSILFTLVESDKPVIITAASRCLATLVSECITDEMVKETLSKSDAQRESTILAKTIATVEGGFSIKYQAAWGGILSILKTMFERLGKSSKELLLHLLDRIAELRVDSALGLKDVADKTLGAAITHVEPELFLMVLPLNLENPGSTEIGRAWLLPLLLLKDHIQNTSLAYFIRELLPMSEKLAQKSIEFQSKNCMIEAKALRKETAEMLSTKLYKKPELRQTICQALKLLVEKNKKFLTFKEDDDKLGYRFKMDKTAAKANVELLSRYAPNYLAVFFNVFSQSCLGSREYILDVINTYLSITSAQDIAVTFRKVIQLFIEACADPVPSTTKPDEPPPTKHVMLDLAITMIPYLDLQDTKQFYDLISNLLSEEDHTQKRIYKTFVKMSGTDNGKIVITQNLDDLQKKLLATTALAAAPAKKDRLRLLSEVVKLLPSDDLHLIPSVLSEVILSTKEAKKIRDAAYDLLVVMGNKMKAGGVVAMQGVVDPDEIVEDAPSTVSASIDEFVFSMVVAGLAATTPYMMNATIASLSRLIFEFKDDLDTSLLHKLLDTVDNFVRCSTKEIVKAALGFVKVVIVSLSTDFLTPHLQQIINGILTWSHEHKGHFKVKVRHIIERLIRRFGYEAVEKCVPDEDKKLLINIKKRKELQKVRRQALTSAYEDALYGSESDLEDSADEIEESASRKPTKSKKDKSSSQIWIKEEEDMPVDFLDRSVVSRIMGTNPRSIRKKPKASSAFKTTGDGRMIIAESDDEDNPAAKVTSDVTMQDVEERYLEAQQSVNAYTRGQGNKIKFKTRKNDMDFDDVEPIDAIAVRNAKKKEKKIVVGKEYRAKRAAGDVKKKGKPDPYAYVPLASIYKKAGQKGSKISMVAKGRVQKRRA